MSIEQSACQALLSVGSRMPKRFSDIGSDLRQCPRTVVRTERTARNQGKAISRIPKSERRNSNLALYALHEERRSWPLASFCRQGREEVLFVAQARYRSSARGC